MTRTWGRLFIGLGLALAVLSTSTSPASATAAGGGVVTGTVEVNPGVDLDPKNTSFTFRNPTIIGAVAIRDNVTNEPGEYAGPIDVSTITGSSTGPEDTIAGAGTIGNFTFNGQVGPVAGVTKRIDGNLSGTYTRVGGIVIVILNGTATIRCDNPPPIPDWTASANITVVVTAVFVPEPGQNGLSPNPGGVPVTSATFAGPFVIAGA